MSDADDDVEAMLEKWNDLDDLTLTGLHVLRDVVERAIEERTEEVVDWTPRVPLPEDPRCKPCWSCRMWINVGEECFTDGDSGKTYHRECRP